MGLQLPIHPLHQGGGVPQPLPEVLVRPRIATVVLLVATAAAGPARAHGDLKLVNGLWYDGQRFVPRTVYCVDGMLREQHAGEARTVDLGGRHVVPPVEDAFVPWPSRCDGAPQLVAVTGRVAAERLALLCEKPSVPKSSCVGVTISGES